MSLQDYQVVTDKQLMQCLPMLRKNWMMLPDCSTFLNRNVQTLGYVFHDTNGQNHEEKMKIPWYFLNETCTVIHWPDCHGRDNSKKLHKNLDGRNYRMRNACSSIGNKGYSRHYMWMTSKWLERSRIWLPCGKR